MGAQYAAEINRQLPIVQNPQVHNYINQLGNSIAQRADQRGIQYTFYVVNSPRSTPSPIPGGHIYINRGLIERAANMSELAGVLGHEIGHVVERHGLDQMARMQNAELGGEPGLHPPRPRASGIEQAGCRWGRAPSSRGTAARRSSRRTRRDQLHDRSGIDPRGISGMFRSCSRSGSGSRRASSSGSRPTR
jgi:beta-barrel assembly-enhancing protease